MADTEERAHNHYFKDVRKLDFVDVYRVLDLFQVSDPSLQHAIKKLLVAGGRGAGKDAHRDVQEAIDSLKRWQEMREEDCNDHKTLSVEQAERQADRAWNRGKQFALDNLSIEDIIATADKHGIKVSVRAVPSLDTIPVVEKPKRGAAKMSARVKAELTRKRKAKQR